MATVQSGIVLLSGAGSPEGAVTGVPGWLYMQTAGVDAGTLWSKKQGTGNSGWIKIAPGGGTDTPALGNQWYVATTGSSSNFGTQGSPWSLDFARTGANAAIKPGDTVWIRGGSYTGGAALNGFDFVLNGTSAQPIVVRGFPGEHVTLLAGSGAGTTAQMAGSYTWLRDLEIIGGACNSGALSIRGTQNKAINCILHDGGGSGLGFQITATGGEAYGNLSYNNGPCEGCVPGCVGDGAYSIYLQNTNSAQKVVKHNIFFNNNNTALLAYGGGTLANLQNILMEGNVCFGGAAISNHAGASIYTGGNSTNLQIVDNHFYELHRASNLRQTARIAADTGTSTGLIFQGNRCYGPVAFEKTLVGATVMDNVFHSTGAGGGDFILHTKTPASTYETWAGNTHYRLSTDTMWRDGDPGSFVNFATWKTNTGLGASDTNPAAAPTGTETVILPNQYEAKRATLVIYNWALAANVSVDLSLAGLAVGDSYVIRNIQNFYATPVVSGTYGGGTVSIPMAGITPVAPIYTRTFFAPPQTGPQFQVFIVRLASA